MSRFAVRNSASSHICVNGIAVSFGDHRVLTDVSFSVSGGDCLGLIGENGAGKSTLLRVIAGLISPTTGEVVISIPGSNDPRTGLLHQEPPFKPGDTITEALYSAVVPIMAAGTALEQAADNLAKNPGSEAASLAYTAALETVERLGLWELDTTIEKMVAGLGIADIPHDRLTSQLSGGQRARLALAWLLLARPDVLLLDEPTNHLDDAATQHLCDELTRWQGPVLIASHDRAFLDEAVTGLIDLDPCPVPHLVVSQLATDDTGAGIGVTRFTGRYTDYLEHQENLRTRWIDQYQREQDELKRLASLMRDSQRVGNPGREPRTEGGMAKKFYADRNAKVVSRRVNDARIKYEDLRARQIRKPPKELNFAGLTAVSPRSAMNSNDGGSILIATRVVLVGRLAPTSIAITPAQKWLITGPNGSGESTLLHILAGRLHPDQGVVTRVSGIRVGLLTQDVVLRDPKNCGPDRTVQQAYQDLVGIDLAECVPLSTFGLIAARDEHRPVTTLSVGQQRRLALATILADPPELLLLDEPTNHLSLALVTGLETAIPDYPGAVVIASHDRWLRREWSGEQLELGGSPRG